MQKGLPPRSFLAEGGQAQVLILAGIVLLIAVAGGIFYLGRISAPKPQNVATSSPQPSPLSTEASAKVEDPTANWKTYTNSTNRFSIKYPTEWIFEEGESVFMVDKKEYPTLNIRFGESNIKDYKGRLFPLVDINIASNPNFRDMKVEEFLDLFRKESYINLPVNSHPIFKDATIGGNIAAKAIYYSGCQSGECLLVLFNQGNTVFAFGISQGSHDKKITERFNQILSTVRFIP